jgi:hypothetical protein
MKLAISVPADIGAKAARLAERWGTSRSAVFAKIVGDYDEGELDPITEAANCLADAMTPEDHAEQQMWIRAGARTVLKHTEW